MKSKKVNYGYYGLPILSIMTVIIILISIIIFFSIFKNFWFYTYLLWIVCFNFIFNISDFNT